MKNELKRLIQLIMKKYKGNIIRKLYGIIKISDFQDKDYRDSKLEHLLQEGDTAI